MTTQPHFITSNTKESDKFYSLHSTTNTSMIFPITSETEVFMMDESDYSEHLLLTSLDDKPLLVHSCSVTALSEATSSLMEEEDMDDSFLDADKVGVVTPTKESPSEKPTSSPPAIDKKQEPKNNDPMSDEKQEQNSNDPMTDEKEEHNNNPAEVGIPNKFDILCGQSRICANHPGNRRFQVVLDLFAPKYDASSSKQEKMALTKEIVAVIANSGGRFLKYQDGLWTEISTVTARDKVSHALRTKVASWRRQQEQQAKPECYSSSAKARPTHRRRDSRRRRSSTSIATSASDIATSSFDSTNSESSPILIELLRTQREIFASLTQSEHGTSSTEKHPLKK
jgi:hypothetical protein